MKEWLRQNPEMLPSGFKLDGATTHSIKNALKQEGWRVDELKTEVHLVPPKHVAPDETKFSGSREQIRQRRRRAEVEPAVESHRTCFVIQPFDKGRFDKRYEDTVRP